MCAKQTEMCGWMTERLIILTSVIFFFSFAYFFDKVLKYIAFCHFLKKAMSSKCVQMGWGCERGLFSSVTTLALRCLYLLCFSVISRAPGLKLVVETLMSSLKPIGNIVVICCAFFIIFGILGVQVREGEAKKLEVKKAAKRFSTVDPSENASICCGLFWHPGFKLKDQSALCSMGLDTWNFNLFFS